MKDQQLFNTMLYSNLHLEEWERVLIESTAKTQRLFAAFGAHQQSEMAI